MYGCCVQSTERSTHFVHQCVQLWSACTVYLSSKRREYSHETDIIAGMALTRPHVSAASVLISALVLYGISKNTLCASIAGNTVWRRAN